MLNLPAIPDVGLPATANDLMTTVLLDLSALPVPEQPVEHTFDSILSGMMENVEPVVEGEAENPVAALPVDILMSGMMPAQVNHWINQPQPVVNTLEMESLSEPPANITSGTSQPVISEPGTFTHSSLLSVEPENTAPDTGQRLTSLLQTTGRANTTTTPFEPIRENMDVSSMISAATYDGFEQANFADGGKILPSSMTSVVMHTGNTLLADTANTTMSDAPVVAAEFGQPDWPEEFSQKITWLATRHMQTAELKLHPAHLGPIEITLQLSGDHQLAAQFVSHHAAVREAVEANLPRLREIMAENGITLTETSVSADTPQQQAEDGQGNAHATASNSLLPRDSTRAHTSSSLIARRTGIIDTFA